MVEFWTKDLQLKRCTQLFQIKSLFQRIPNQKKEETLVMQKIRKVFTFDWNPYLSASQFVP